MARKDPRIDRYVTKAAPFARPILRHLRKIVHAGCPEVEETIKWQCPSFSYHGIMCGMAAFNQHCAFGFWKTELLFDGDRAADREAMGNFGRITSLADLPGDAKLISYVRRAAKLNKAGVKSPRTKPKKKPAPKIPNYFRDALRKNTKAGQTFERFSPSQQRDYVEWLTEAKRDETRDQRLKMSMLWLSQGKPRNWKYMPEWR
jgi:uncharacterized protein YdeI (YjbR/CyaY-like superfamily)